MEDLQYQRLGEKNEAGEVLGEELFKAMAVKLEKALRIDDMVS